MKTRNYIFLTALMLFFSFLNAQTNTNWQPVLISMDGTNGYKGVELYYSLETCNSTDVVKLKLVNTNTFALKAHWITVLVTNSDKELYGKTELVTVQLDANKEYIGTCKKTDKLTIKLSDYGIKATDLKTMVGSNFDISH